MAEAHQEPLQIQRERVIERPAGVVERPSERAGVAESTHRIRWGAVWAGVIVGLATYLVLLALGAALGLGPAAAGWWGGIMALVALFLGGYIAGLFTGEADVATSVVQGALVWALTLLVLPIVGAIVGSLVGQVVDPDAFRGVANMLAARPELGLQAAWWFVLANLLAFAAAAFGAYSGAMTRRPVTVRREATA